MSKECLGRIDCSYCGTINGMKITADKNGKPFGYCDAKCDGQKRWGGNKQREDGFAVLHPDIALSGFPGLYPHLVKKGVGDSVTDTGTGKTPAQVQPKPASAGFNLGAL